MNSPPINIQRDGLYINNEQADQAWSPEFLVASTHPFEGLATVFIDKGSVHTYLPSTITAGYLESIGVYMQNTLGDRTPYRCQGSIPIAKGFLIIGYGPATPTGTDTIIEPVYIPINNNFDITVIVEESPTYPERALAFSIAFHTSGALTADPTPAVLSIQNLGVKPPTMQNAVS